jgi:transketolase
MRYIIPESSSNKEYQFVLSKGHAAIALYSVLTSLEIMSENDLDKYCENGSQLYGHINHLAHPIIELSTGSLGHGMPFGVGLAHAKKLRQESGLVFVLMSDGELNEGTTWESALLANKLSLNNLVCVIDRNFIQSLESTESTLPLEPLKKKWEAFDWEVAEIDGHNFESMEQVNFSSKKPKVLIANTVKGKGVSWMENEVLWHYKWPSENQLNAALESLDEGR